MGFSGTYTRQQKPKNPTKALMC